MSQAFNIEFTYDDRFMVQIGTTDNIEKKLQFLLTVVDGLSTTEKGTIDVTDVSTARFIP